MALLLLDAFRTFKSVYPTSVVIYSIFPELKEVLELVEEITAEHRERRERDKNKTPIPVLLGVVARYQEHECLCHEDESKQLAEEDRQAIVSLCRNYWQHITIVGKGIRRGITLVPPEQLEASVEWNRLDVAGQLGIPGTDLLKVWVSEMGDTSGLETHCPDYALSVDRQMQCLVLTLLGTRMQPAPNMHDIVMDLKADSQPFLGGEAHAGMAIGARNILAAVIDQIVEVLEKEASLSLLVLGYSLGAGMAQLVTASLLEGEEAARLPEGTKVRCLAYGAPPVFCSQQVKSFPEIVIVHHNMDGIICSSIRTFTDLFNKVVALDAANLDTKTMVGMILGGKESSGEQCEANVEEDNQENTEEESSSWTGWFVNKIKGKVNETVESMTITEEDWLQVKDAIDHRKMEDTAVWTLLGRNILQMNRVEDNVDVRWFSGPEAAERFTKELRLDISMFNDHMPWGYSGLFTKTESTEECSANIECLDCFV